MLALILLTLWVRGQHTRDLLIVYYHPEGWGHTIYLTSTTGQLHIAKFYAKRDQRFVTLSSGEAIREEIYHDDPWSAWWYTRHDHKAIGMLAHIVPTWLAAAAALGACVLAAPSRRLSLRSLMLVVTAVSVALAIAQVRTPEYFAQFGDWMPASENSRRSSGATTR